MNDNEVNKIIAEFMGIDFVEVESISIRGKTCRAFLECSAYFTFPCYTKSLDALVPVWEKLGKDFFCWFDTTSGGFEVRKCSRADTNGGRSKQRSKDNIYLAAAHATAAAIQELI